MRLGIIDTAVSDNHPAFAGADIEHQAFIPAGLMQPQSHGTAVAGVLVGANNGLVPLLGNAKLLVASAFYSRDTSAPGATLMSLVNALGWLAGQRVQVINMSLAGPHNDILQRVIASLAAKNIAIVAAVGNQGPASPPLYPAAYPGVIGVTAVDANQRIYRWANRGEQVDFAAPGVKVATVKSTGGIGHHTGTSIAAPVVSAHLACTLHATKQNVDFALAQLRDRAVDLGEQGRDYTFGDGLLAR
ncbi:MAG: S8 family serine peptidase [Pseudomonadales bacterium]|nr:S8 family serine peptidase [Pseudomonadales bacterium]